MSKSFAESLEDSFFVKFTVNLARSQKGSFVLEIHPSWAPLGVARLRELLDEKFFNGCRFFRVVPNFMAQFGNITRSIHFHQTF